MLRFLLLYHALSLQESHLLQLSSNFQQKSLVFNKVLCFFFVFFRKDSEQTKQIEELQKTNEELVDAKERLLEEIERILSEGGKMC